MVTKQNKSQIKKVIKGLNKASKTHAAQAKVLNKVVSTKSKKSKRKTKKS